MNVFRISIVFFCIIFLLFHTAIGASVEKITCDELYPTFKGECRIEGECYKGLLIATGKDVVAPVITFISDVFKSIELVPKQEGEIKIIAVCFKPKIEVKRLKVTVRKASFSSSKDFSTAIAYLKVGMKNALVTNLPPERCFWVHPFFNGSHYLLLIDVFRGDESKCNGIPIETREILLERPLNIYAKDQCVCGSEVLLENVMDGIRVRVRK